MHIKIRDIADPFFFFSHQTVNQKRIEQFYLHANTRLLIRLKNSIPRQSLMQIYFSEGIFFISVRGLFISVLFFLSLLFVLSGVAFVFIFREPSPPPPPSRLIQHIGAPFCLSFSLSSNNISARKKIRKKN